MSPAFSPDDALWIPDSVAILVTWRLAGTLPSCYTPPRNRMEEDSELDQKVVGPRWLADPTLAEIVAKAVQFGATSRNWYELYAWVVMPNHVHVVMRPSHDLSEIMRWLKWTTARRCNSVLQRTGTRFWQVESYDHWIRDRDEYRATVHYVEQNPVSAGLVECAENWLWLSASSR